MAKDECTELLVGPFGRILFQRYPHLQAWYDLVEPPGAIHEGGTWAEVMAGAFCYAIDGLMLSEPETTNFMTHCLDAMECDCYAEWMREKRLKKWTPQSFRQTLGLEG